MNRIVRRTDNVNFTTVKTAGESAGIISRFDELVNLSKFALGSEPERQDAVQQISHALNSCRCAARRFGKSSRNLTYKPKRNTRQSS